MDKATAVEQLISEIATACDLDPASLTADTRIKEDLNLTSMQRMIITGVVEDLTDTAVYYSTINKCKSIGDIADFVVAHT